MGASASGHLAMADSTVLVRANFADGVTPGLARIVTGLADQGARVAIISGFGDPGGDVNPALSLSRFAEPFAEATGKPVTFIAESVGTHAEAWLARVPFGEIALMENLRFHPDESRKAKVFAVCLSILADCYVDVGKLPLPQNGWQVALRLLLPKPRIAGKRHPIQEDA